MNRYEMGRRIKEARLSKKMTQADVAGGFITRNMLSQIESGAANPSLKSLEYISSVLDIPISVLMADEKGEDGEADGFLGILKRAKMFFNNEEYKNAIEQAELLAESELCDEAYALISRSYLKLAELSEKKNEASEAAELADKAYSFAERGIYASRDIRTTAALIIDRSARKLKRE